ncbi:MAG: heme ABC exporter ATP-binding protein CcmA [Firmicutes bacterium]|nr:heme ABC exporter ATP-binding protein CcmA [Alicyclobacillaceae bacterium]MCL6497736.1 heme ABC exporter ATP-binding protein CcmA [Bacillota bacterium]
MVLQHVQKRIGERWVLSDVSVVLGAGRALAVLGPNGAGKSTLLRVAAGLWSPSGGMVYRFGRRGTPDHTASDPRVGLVGHQSFLYPALTALENLMVYGRLYGLSRPKVKAEAALERFGLRWSANEPLKTFSRGMKQRLSLARAWLSDPELLLLDEPFSGLDLEGQELLTGWLAEHRRRGGAQLLITHSVEEALKVGDAVAILMRGRLVWWGSRDAADEDGLRVRYREWLSKGGIGSFASFGSS